MTKPPPIKPLAMSVDDAAASLSVSRRYVHKLISQGRLASLRVGGRRLIPVRAVEALLDTAELASAEPEIDTAEPETAETPETGAPADDP